MKAAVRASSLSKALKTCLKKSSSPRLVFDDDGVFVLSEQVKIMQVEGVSDVNGWGHVEWDRAQKIVKILDVLGEYGTVTIAYEGNWVRFVDLRL